MTITEGRNDNNADYDIVSVSDGKKAVEIKCFNCLDYHMIEIE